MQQESLYPPPHVRRDGLWQKLGLPQPLFWGYIGIFLFITGATIEQSWLSSLLIAYGYSGFQIGVISSAFGLCVALSSWFSGIGSQVFGLRTLMWAGTIVFFVTSLPFVLYALPGKNYDAIILTYMLRGVAYPLFAYSFLVWINVRTDKAILGRAVSWFWSAFAVGMTILGPWLSSLAMPLIGEQGVLLTGFLFVAAGAFSALVLNHDRPPADTREQNPGRAFVQGLLIMFQQPKLGLAVIVKTINDIGKFSLIILMPIYLPRFGFRIAEWLTIWSAVNILNLFSGYFFGYLGDIIGWRKTVVWFSGTLCGISAILVCYAPVWFGHSQAAIFAALAVYAIGLGAFGPLAALIPTLSPGNKGAAISCLNLGSGLSNFAGPLIVSLCIVPLGIEGTLWVIALLYFLASLLTIPLKAPE
ncbi:MFS transporter [Musicola keenii]|uniref:MFS transporter n=1 Tax=Musicola keenii TaxID=2884250 RepID=UPI001784EDFD|nr:MFS transporter [Musicola keenii]